MGRGDGGRSGTGAATNLVPQAAIKKVADTLRDVGTDSGAATGGKVFFLFTRMANGLPKAQTTKFGLEKCK